MTYLTCQRHALRTRTTLTRVGAWLALTGATIALLTACGKPTSAPGRPPVEVTEITVTPQDTPVAFEFVAQSQSSRQVEIRARVEGFLEKRLYTEGSLVQAGQTLFQMDRKPFEAALLSAQGQLAQQQARLTTAQANLARVRPLVKTNALSKKDLDDAIGAERSAAASVIAAQGQVQTARLNLSYATIESPLTGLSSYAKKQDGSYLTPGEGGLLTTVEQVDPIWINFSISENELLKYRDEVAKGRLKFPASDDFQVEVILADGTVHPDRGRINFANPSFSVETGTFLVRAEVANPQGALKPGQFVRAKVIGAVKLNAITLPQRAVLQGAKSHYVWVINKEGKAEERMVSVGDWHGDDWFINQGLNAGERVVVDGAIRVNAGAALKIVTAPAAGAPGKTAEAPSTEEQKPKPPDSTGKSAP